MRASVGALIAMLCISACQSRSDVDRENTIAVRDTIHRLNDALVAQAISAACAQIALMPLSNSGCERGLKRTARCAGLPLRDLLGTGSVRDVELRGGRAIAAIDSRRYEVELVLTDDSMWKVVGFRGSPAFNSCQAGT